MREYLRQLWTDPAFFANTVKAVGATAATGGLAYMVAPEAAPLWKQMLIVVLGTFAGGAASLPSAKK